MTRDQLIACIHAEVTRQAGELDIAAIADAILDAMAEAENPKETTCPKCGESWEHFCHICDLCLVNCCQCISAKEAEMRMRPGRGGKN